MAHATKNVKSDEEETPALQDALERAERAEQEVAELKEAAGQKRQQPVAKDAVADQGENGDASSRSEDGIDELRKDAMMAHLLDSLERGEDIGHYGRLVFAMIARHFLNEEEVIGWLTKDSDFSEEAAALMMKQVQERNYNPPRKERIVEWQHEQKFAILPNPDDPDCGNVYRTLKFPEGVYDHIQNYQAEKMETGSK